MISMSEAPSVEIINTPSQTQTAQFKIADAHSTQPFPLSSFPHWQYALSLTVSDSLTRGCPQLH